MAATPVRTEHPHVVRVRGAADVEEPYVVGTRIAVRDVVEQYHIDGSVEGVLQAFPHLTPAQVHDALSYAYDHSEEIERLIEWNQSEEWLDQPIPNLLQPPHSRR